MNRSKSFLVVLAVLLGALAAAAQPKRAISFDDLMAMHRIAEPQISPDGNWVVYSVGTPDLEANRIPRNLWLVPLAGGEPKQLTRSGRDSHPRWAPDSKRIAFISSRDGTPQVYIISIEGGEATKLTEVSGGAANVLWSPDGKWIAFTSDVYPDCGDDACNRRRDEERERSRVRARIYETLLYRHWDTWEDGKVSHLFVVPASGGTPRDLTPETTYDVPPFSLGGPEPIAFSPDGAELCYTAITDAEQALSTNADLFVVPVAGGPSRRITTNPGYDGGPAYSPDGRWIAYRAQFQYGYESDRWRLMLYSRTDGRHLNLTEKFDRSVEGPVWSADSQTIYFQAEDRGYLPVFSIPAAPGHTPKVILPASYNGELALSPDGRTLVVSRSSLQMPAELFVADVEGTGVRQLTFHNAARLAQLELHPAEHFWFPGAGGTRIHGMLLRPPQFDPNRKYPLLLLLHGGPQTMWGDSWGYRWNPQVFAAPGYVVLMINRRGSTGFGQAFVDEIRGDYGGKPYEDLMRGVDYVLEKYSFVDGNRMAAAGGSYGGFMANWIATHTGRFRAIITHASIFEQVSMYGATEELWFMEWDQMGTPWTNPEGYRKWSPASYAAALGKFKTPTLVIHGELDYRVPYTQGLQMFTALQRQGVPSKLLLFPDEGHWILKPQNSRLWYQTFLDWLARWLR